MSLLRIGTLASIKRVTWLVNIRDRSVDGVVATDKTVQARLREGRTLGSTVVKGPMKRSLRQRLGRSRWRNGSIPRPCLGARCGKHIREGCLEKGAGWAVNVGWFGIWEVICDRRSNARAVYGIHCLLFCAFLRTVFAGSEKCLKNTCSPHFQEETTAITVSCWICQF